MIRRLIGIGLAAWVAAMLPAAAQVPAGNASLSVTTSSARVALPLSTTSFPVVLIAPSPTSTQEVFYKLGDVSVVATTSSAALPGGGICINVGPSSNAYVAAITASSTATLRITQLNSCPIFARGGGSGPPGSGTVTSVDATVPAYMTIAGNPITTSGTLAFDFATQSGNKVFASPSSGALGAMSMRTLVAADIPSLTCAKLTDASAFCSSADAANLTGTVASARITGSYTGITGTGTLAAGATGAGFTVALSTSTITGTLADARLSTNVPLLNASNLFVATNYFDGSFVLSGRIDVTIAADQNNWTPTGSGTYANVTEVFVDGGVADRNITGLTGGVAGRVMAITNKGTTNAIILKNQSGSSTATNQFLLTADVTLPANTSLVLRYDGLASMWRPWGRALANQVTAGSFGSATQVGTFTVDVSGRLTAAANVTITPAASSITGGAALTKTDDTNVTLTLGGAPTTALLAATSITVGWTGTLALSRLAQGTDGQLIVGQTAASPLYKTLSGDATLSAAGALTLASTIVAGGPTGSATVSAIITYDAKGRLTTVSSATIAPPFSAVTGSLACSQHPALTGDVTTSAGSCATTLATVNANVGSFGSATQVGTFTVNAKGLLTAAANVTVTPAVGSITGLGTGVATWLATPSSANLLAAITDETGTGPLVFATAPTFTTTIQLGTVSSATGQVLLANSASAFLTTLQAGNAAAARTWTLPTNFGSAGCVLTDAAANGVLSCATAGGGYAGVTTGGTGALVFAQSVNLAAIAATGGGNTGSNAASMVDMSWTLNTSGSPDVIAYRITDTARGATTKLFNVYAGAAGTTSVFSINRSGVIYGNNGVTGLAFAVGNGIGANVIEVSTSGDSVEFVGGTGGVTQLSLNMGSGNTIGWASTSTVTRSTTPDTIMRRGGAAATLQHGAADAASPVAQTIRFQSVVAGTSNTAGANATFQGSAGTGTGVGGNFIIQLAAAGTTGTSQNTLTEVFKLDTLGSLSLGTGSNSFRIYTQSSGNQQVTFTQISSTTLVDVRANSFLAGAANTAKLASTGVILDNNGVVSWTPDFTYNAADTFLKRAAAATIQQGAADAAAPVAQGLRVQSVVAGTTNTAGVNWTFRGSLSTGSGASGDIIFQTGGTGAGATAQNAATTALTIKGATQVVQIATSFTAPTGILSALAADTAQVTATVCAETTTGQLYKGSGTLGICLGTSSLRFKDKVVPFQGGVAEVMALEPVSFFYRKGYGDGGLREQGGFLAEDMVKVLPKLVGLDAKERPNTIDMVGMVPLIINAIKELKADNDNLRAELAKRAAAR